MLIQTGKGKLKPLEVSVILPVVFCCVFSLLINSTAYAKAENKHDEIRTLTKTFKFSLEDISFDKNGIYDEVKLEEGSINQNVVGVPAVPVKYVNILLASGAEVTGISATSEQQLIATDILVVPVQRPRQVSAAGPPEWKRTC